MQIYKPDLIRGYTAATNVTTFPSFIIARTTKFTRIPKNGADFYVVYPGLLLISFIQLHINVTFVPIKGAVTSVIADSGNFNIGSYESNTFYVTTMATSGEVVCQQEYQFQSKASTIPLLGYNTLYTFDPKQKPQFCVLHFNGTVQHCVDGLLSVLPERGSFLFLKVDQGTTIQRIFVGSWSLTPLYSHPKPPVAYDDSKGELIAMTSYNDGQTLRTSFVIFHEGSDAVELLVADMYPTFALIRFNTSVGTINCYSSEGCFLSLADLYAIDASFPLQVGRLENAPQYYQQTSLDCRLLFQHNMQSFPELTWFREAHMLYLQEM